MKRRYFSLIALCFLSVFPVIAHESFTIYAPSRNESGLIFLKFTPGEGDEKGRLERANTLDLTFKGRTIAQHPEMPVLYLSGQSSDKESSTNGSVVFLEEKTGNQKRSVPIAFDRDYSYLSLDRSRRFLFGCSYGEGIIDVYPLNEEGIPGESVASVQEGRKAAHCVLASPDNKNLYIPYVKEHNALLQYDFDAATGKVTALEPKNANPPEGTGPRHLAYHPTLPLLYFSEEQGLGVSIYKRDEDGKLTFSERVCAISEDVPSDGTSSSDIVMTPNHKFIFTGFRSREDNDAISRFAVQPNGSLKVLGVTKTDDIPWGLAASPDGNYLVVTAFKGGKILVYKIGVDGDLSLEAELPVEQGISDVETR